MAETAEKTTNNKQGPIIAICIGVILVVAIIVAIVIALNNNGISSTNYFESNDTQLVMTLDANELITSGEEFAPLRARIVYKYSGDKITDVTSYYEFENSNSAKAGLDYLIAQNEGNYKDIYIDGNYVVIVSNESDYSDLTIKDVKDQIEFMEMLKNADTTEQGESTTEDSGSGTIIVTPPTE